MLVMNFQFKIMSWILCFWNLEKLLLMNCKKNHKEYIVPTPLVNIHKNSNNVKHVIVMILKFPLND